MYKRQHAHIALLALDERRDELPLAADAVELVAVDVARQDGGVERRPEGAGALSLIHISQPTRLGMISYAVFFLKKKKKVITNKHSSKYRQYIALPNSTNRT